MADRPDPAPELMDAVTQVRLIDAATAHEARADPRGSWQLPPAPEGLRRPEADQQLEEALWRYALRGWQMALGNAQPDLRLIDEGLDLIELWRSTGRPDNLLGTGLHSAELLAIRRLRAIADRAAAGRPVCPELETTR